MATIRRPSSAARPTAPSRAAPATSSYRGADGLRRMQQEAEVQHARAEARKNAGPAAHRFFMMPGETREYIIVDDQPDFFRWEHNLRDSDGRYKIHTPCVKESANCPICESNPEKPSYFAMFLTVIDLTPYESDKYGVVEWSKKLLCVKHRQHAKFARYLERYGSLRGLLISASRDGDKDPAIGNDMEVVQQLTEEELEQYYTTYNDKDNNVVEVFGNEVFDYDQVLPEMTEEMLASYVGRTARNHAYHRNQIGSRSSARSGDGFGDDPPARPARAAPSPRQAPAARGAAPAGRAPNRPPPREVEPEGEDDTVYGDEEQEAAPAPRRPVPPSAPARVATRQAALPPAPQRGSATGAAPARSAPVSAADRRRQLRGG